MINIPPAEWGYSLWTLFYVAAGNKKFFQLISSYIPCDECKQHYISNFDVNNTDINSVIEFHKKVCDKLKKPYIAPIYNNQESNHNALFKYLKALVKAGLALIEHTEMLECLADIFPEDYRAKFKTYLPLTKSLETVDTELRLFFVYKPDNFIPIQQVRTCCGGRKII